MCPILAAFIWGTAFVAQSVSTDYVGAFTFNAVRSLIGSVALLIVVFILRRFRKNKTVSVQDKRAYRKMLILGGLSCGIILTAASNLQQFGLSDTHGVSPLLSASWCENAVSRHTGRG